MKPEPVLAEDVTEGDEVDGPEGQRFLVVEIERKPKTVVFHLQPIGTFTAKIRCRYGEYVPIAKRWSP